MLMDQGISYPARLQAACKLAGPLEQAVAALETSLPLDPNVFDPDRLDLEVSLALDAFRVRFSDLQDILGRSLFPAIARADEDETPAHLLTMRERIALMKKRGIIDADKWREIREVRNQFAHEYPDDQEENAANLNVARRLTGELLETNRRVLDYARRQHGVKV